MKQHMVELVGVTKTFGETIAVDDVSLSIGRGEFITLLGPSGCGKTTTLRLIAGFIFPDNGQILINGEYMEEKPAYERNLGMVFQNYALFPHMTAYENIAFGLKMRKFDKPEIDKKVKEALELVKLSGLDDRYPRQLSGGQQQRISLARALVIEPDVLLLDEPLSNLDLKLREAMRLELKDIYERIGITFVYVTHDQGEALTLSDRIAIMSRGKIMQIGTPNEVYEQPTNRFVADFIGEANIFNGKLVEFEEEQAKVVTNEGLTFYSSSLSFEKPEEVEKNSDVNLSLRPQKIRIERKKTQEKNSFQGKIQNIVYLGSTIKYHVIIDEKTRRFVIEQQISEGTTLHKIGDEVYVEWTPENCLVLPG